MNKYKIVQKIEKFAPLETAESWDYCGWIIETSRKEVSKVMLALTPCKNIIEQAKSQNCDMIISHHPLFCVPTYFSSIDIYCAHTNLDKAKGGTTDTIIKTLGFKNFKTDVDHEFLRMVKLPEKILIKDFTVMLHKISQNLRYVNNKNIESIKNIAFCAGSGTEFISDAKNFDADCFVTGDLKFHTALDSSIVLFDIGHFESEIIILPVLKSLIPQGVEIIYAKEKSPFVYE